MKSTLILCYGQVAVNAPPEKILNRIDQDILRCISKHFNTKVNKEVTGAVYAGKLPSPYVLILFLIIFLQESGLYLYVSSFLITFFSYRFWGLK